MVSKQEADHTPREEKKKKEEEKEETRREEVTADRQPCRDRRPLINVVFWKSRTRQGGLALAKYGGSKKHQIDHGICKPG